MKQITDNQMIGLIGHFMYDQEQAAVNGQAVKTRNFYRLLCRHYGEETVQTLDTNYFRRHLLKNYRAVFRLCRRCGSILILPTANGLKLLLPVLAVLKKRYGFQLLYPVVGGWLPEYLQGNPMVRGLMKSVDWIYPETEDMSRAIRKLGLGNVETLPNFSVRQTIDSLPDIPWERPPFRLCTFSRVMEEKGIGEAVRAVLEVNRAGHNCTLDIYGPVAPDYAQTFEGLLAEAGDAVAYRGVLSGDEIVPTLSRYYAMLFPTVYAGEGMPGAVLEAFAAGVPVLATDWRYNGEVIDHGRTGLLYPPSDREGLKAAIVRAVSDPEGVLRMKRACLNESRRYAPEAVMRPVFDRIDGYNNAAEEQL